MVHQAQYYSLTGSPRPWVHTRISQPFLMIEGTKLRSWTLKVCPLPFVRKNWSNGLTESPENPTWTLGLLLCGGVIAGDGHDSTTEMVLLQGLRDISTYMGVTQSPLGVLDTCNLHMCSGLEAHFQFVRIVLQLQKGCTIGFSFSELRNFSEFVQTQSGFGQIWGSGHFSVPSLWGTTKVMKNNKVSQRIKKPPCTIYFNVRTRPKERQNFMESFKSISSIPPSDMIFRV